MQKEEYVTSAAFLLRRRGKLAYLVGNWLLVLLALATSCAQAQAPDLTYAGPLTITKGGTYTGNYRSTDSNVPVVTIRTIEPVILNNCTLVGPGELIYAPVQNTDLTVRETRGYGATPTSDNTMRGAFLYMYKGQNLVLEHNYLEGNHGITLDRWMGNGTSNQTVKVRYNKAVNLTGTYRNAAKQESAAFLLMNTVRNVANMEIAWNQIVNQPNQSAVGDNINFYNSGGVNGGVARVHDNYVQGAYPLPATSTSFSGTGMTTDGDGATPSDVTAYLEIDNNQFVSTCNAGINVAAGHDINVHNNRVVTSGYLSTGEKLGLLSCGITPFNYYKSPAATFGNIRIVDNTVGYANWSGHSPFDGRNDINPLYATVYTGNSSLPNPLTVQTEQAEWTLWQQKIQQNNITPGLTGSTGQTPVTPTLSTPTPTPTTPTTPTVAVETSFYRAFNLNGGAITIDGNSWEAGSSVQVSGGINFVNQGVTLNPATDASRASMIRSSTYGSHVKLTVANVPSADYQVYIYVWEDNSPETFDIVVNDQTAKSKYNSGTAGHWERLGPFATTVANGTLTVAADGGAANFSGLEIWRVGAAVSTPTTPSPSTGFYRAINLNGTALTIDGNAWEGSSASNYSVNGTSYSLPGQQLSPTTDASRATMLRSCQYSSSLDFRLTSVPSGLYQVYAYVWEDNNSETYSVAVNGLTRQSGLKTGSAGAWTKIGPYLTTVTNGTIQLTTSGGVVNLSGVEVWRLATVTVGSASTASLVGSALADAADLATTVQLYPNPLSGGQSQVQLITTVAQAEEARVQVLTAAGVLRQQATLALPAGTSTQVLDVGDLPQGLYLVRFVSGSLAGTSLHLNKAD